MRDAIAQLEWAEKRILDVSGFASGFLKDAFSISVEEHRTREGMLFILEPKREIPLTVSVDVGKIIQALRSSLDIAISSIVRSQGGTNSRNIYFPIFPTENDFSKSVKKLSPFLNTRELSVLEHAQPFNGNPIFLALKEMSNTDKHVQLLSLDIERDSLHFRMPGRDGGGGVRFVALYEDFRKKGNIAIAWDADPGVQPEMEFRLIFREVPGFKKANAIGLLKAFKKEVETVILALSQIAK